MSQTHFFQSSPSHHKYSPSCSSQKPGDFPCFLFRPLYAPTNSAPSTPRTESESVFLPHPYNPSPGYLHPSPWFYNSCVIWFPHFSSFLFPPKFILHIVLKVTFFLRNFWHICLFILKFLLEYSCFTMLRWPFKNINLQR